MTGVDLFEPGTDAYHELVAIYRRDGVLTAEAVLAAAKKQRSALHPYFEWDDAAAAMKHRLEQARQLIKSYRVRVIAEDAETVQVTSS